MLYNVGKMFSLPPRDTCDGSKRIDKRRTRINTIQQPFIIRQLNSVSDKINAATMVKRQIRREI